MKTETHGTHGTHEKGALKQEVLPETPKKASSFLNADLADQADRSGSEPLSY